VRAIKRACIFICIFILVIGPSYGLIERIDFVDTAVIDVVQALAKQAGLDLIISGDQSMAQTRRTTLHLKNISPEDAIQYILTTNGLHYEKKGNVLLVSMLPQDQSTSAYREVTEVCGLQHLSSQKLSELLLKILPELKINGGGATRSLILQGKPDLVNDAKKIIASIDKPVPQVLIESQVVEIDGSQAEQMGITYGKDNGTIKITTAKDTKKTSLAEDIQVTIKWLVTTGKARVVANPRLATLDNCEAVINIGSRVPYAVPVTSNSSGSQWTVEYIDAGVKLKITPSLGEDGYITTSIQPEVSSVSEWKTTPAGEFPVITTRNAQATLRVKDGETIVVAGLLSEADRENISKLPILGDLPVAGNLFKCKTTEKSRTEIIFLITPHISRNV
jgi:type II secretory pathway component GspD/PulD (secretin)